MKSIIISAENNSTLKLLLELAKKMGLHADIRSEKEMKWDFMPETDRELENTLDLVEKRFNKGKFHSSAKALSRVKKWK